MNVREIIQVARKLDIRLYSMELFEAVACKLYDYIVSYGRFLVPVHTCPLPERVPRVDNVWR